MSNVTWCNQRPRKPGFYWYWDNMMNDPCLMKVYENFSEGGTYWCEGGELLFALNDEESIDDSERWSFEPVAVPASPYIPVDED